MAGFFFDSFAADALSGRFVVGTDTFYMMLVSTTPSQSASKRSDITGEVSGSGYTAGGAAVTLTLPAVSSHVQNLAAAQVQWNPITLGAAPAGGVIYKRRGGAASADELVGFVQNTGTGYGTGITFTMPAHNFTLTMV